LFASTVDAGHHQDHGLLIANVKLLLERHEQICNGFNQQGFDCRRLCGLACFDASFEVLQQVLCGFDPCISQQQGRFELFVQSVIYLRASKDGRNAAAGFAQSSFEFTEP
jgi:hypothetical protein